MSGRFLLALLKSNFINIEITTVFDISMLSLRASIRWTPCAVKFLY